MVDKKKPDSKKVWRPSNGVLKFLQDAWAVIVAELDAVRGAPVIVLPLILCAVLMFQEQGADLAATASSDLSKSIWLVLTTAFYGYQCWFWARLVVERTGERAAAPEQTDPPWVGKLAWWLKTWTPRILGAAPFFIASIATLKAGAGLTLSIVLITLGGLTPFILRARLPIAELLGLEDGDRFYLASMRITLVLGVGSLVVLCLWPVGPARLVGAIGVVFLGLSFITAALAAMVNLSRRLQLPVLAALVLLIVLVGGWVSYNHEVGRRTLHRVDPRDAMALRGDKPDLATRLDAWCQAQPGGCNQDPGKDPTPIVFVAAEGGASRAGYWAADVLGRLQYDTRNGTPFSDKVFAISSVSGGSVGVMSYVSTLADTPDLKGAAFADSVAEVAGVDYLSPAISGLLFPDLAFHLLPFPIFPDRAETLETGFESGWRGHCRNAPSAPGADGCDAELWTKPFLSIWRPESGAASKRWLPVVLINGARQEDGRRIITSDIRVTPDVFPNAVDFHDLIERDVRVSTAIHNGARFPVVSPGGLLIAAKHDDEGNPNGEHYRAGHVIDGGYFDGGGVVTMAQTAAAVMRLAKIKGYRLKPVLIELNNDNDKGETAASLIRGDNLGDCQAQAKAEADARARSESKILSWLRARLPSLFKPPERESPCAIAKGHDYRLHKAETRRFLVDVLGPVEGLASVRSAHGEAAGMALAQTIEDYNLLEPAKDMGDWGLGPVYQLVHLCETQGVKLPMDWALSRAAMRRTDGLLTIQSADRLKGEVAGKQTEEDDKARDACMLSRRIWSVRVAVGEVPPRGPKGELPPLEVQVRHTPGDVGDGALRTVLWLSIGLALVGAGANAWANGKLKKMALKTTVDLQRFKTAEAFAEAVKGWKTPAERPDVWRLLRIAFCFDLPLIAGYAGLISAGATLLAQGHPSQDGVLLTASLLALAAAVADLSEDAFEARMIYVSLKGLPAVAGARWSEDDFARAAFTATRLKWTFLAGAVAALAWGGIAGWLAGG